MASLSHATKRRRILALWFPRLPTDRLQRRREVSKTQKPSDASPETASAPPLVVVATVDNALRLSAVDRRATSLGLVAGMPLANARAMLPALTVTPADEPADRKLLERIADWCERFTPLVALDRPRALLLDITGAAHLFGGEAAMLDQVRSSLAKQGFAVRGAIAGTTAAARALARYKDGAVAPPGEEAVFVAPLPAEALNLDPVTTHALRRAGLKTVRQVASRDRAELAARFDAGMVFTLDNALGRVEQPISPRIPPPDYSVKHQFAEPIVTQDAALAALKALASRLAAILEEHGNGARCLEAGFFRVDGVVRRIVIEMGKPTREPVVIERLFREKLDALADPLDSGFGYDLIRLCASRVERADSETIDFDGDANAERDICCLIDCMAARFGGQRILTFQPNDTHIPEAAAVAVPAQYAKTIKAEWETIRGRGEAPRRPLRLFTEPEPVDVIAEIPEGPPLQFCWRRALYAVAFAEGPERIAMEWWRHRETQPTRDYFRVEDKEGKRFWLYRSGIYGRETAAARWFMHGIFA
jgi:protein ImuB